MLAVVTWHCIYTLFKAVLNFCTKCSSIDLRAMTLSVFILKNGITWNLVSKCAPKMLLNLDQHGRTTWASHVRLLLYRYGFREVWDAQGVGNMVLFLREFTDRVKQVYSTDWEHDLEQSSKLYLFKSLKDSGIYREEYLYKVTIRKYRAGLAKLRCSSHDLRIEKGRHKSEPVAERVCRLCFKADEQHVLEDEYHFLMCCPQYADLREKYLPDWVQQSNTYANFLLLLSNEEEEILKSLASYIYQANKLRWALLKALEL